MAHTVKNTSGTLYWESHPLRQELEQVYKIRGQLGLCWCLHHPFGEKISKAVRSTLA